MRCALFPKLWSDELSFSGAVFFLAFCWPVPMGHMRSSSGDSPLRGESLCLRVDPCLESGFLPGRWHALACARTDGASVSSGGRERHSILTRCSFPLGSPIWGFTARRRSAGAPSLRLPGPSSSYINCDQVTQLVLV